MSIRDDVADIRSYLVELRELLADQASGGDGGRGGKVIDSPAPWNAPVGELLTDIHAGARRMADELDALTGRPPQARGAADAGTMAALDHVGTAVERLRTWYAAAAQIEAAEGEVARWAREARVLLGIVRTGDAPWSRAPGLRCPNPVCGAPLYLAPGWVLQVEPPVHCLRCRCTDGTPVRWSYAEWHPLVHQAV